MPTNRNIGQANRLIDGDQAFLGVDERLQPSQLPQGIVSKATNVEFANGRAETRGGLSTQTWSEDQGETFDWLWNKLGDGEVETAPVVLTPAGSVTATQFTYIDATTGAETQTFAYSDITGLTGITAGDIVTIAGFVDTDWNGTWEVFAVASTTIHIKPTLQLWNDVSPNFEIGGAEAVSVTFPGTIEWDTSVGYGSLCGVGRFSDPDGNEYGLLCKGGSRVIRIKQGTLKESIFINPTVAVTSPVTFTQAFNKVIMFRGENNTPLVFDTTDNISTGLADFTEITQTTAGDTADSTESIPNADFGVVLGGRLWVPKGRDTVAFSDIEDYTRYISVYQQLRVNVGSDDRITALVPYNQNSLVVFKDQSVHLISNIYATSTTEDEIITPDMRQDVLTRSRGCVARDTAIEVGRDIWFLSTNGIYTLSQALDNKLQAGVEPVSAPVQPIIDRINSGYIADSRAVYHDNKYYLAFPLDDSTYNNALLVYDFINQQWSGLWTSDYLDVLAFLKLDHDGEKRLYIVSGDNHSELPNHGALFMVNEGYADYRFDEETEISTMLETRGYTGGMPGMKQWNEMSVDISTWRPSYTITLLKEGANESDVVVPTTTKSRSTYYTKGTAAYVTANTNDDHANAYREDYSVDLSADAAVETGVNGFDPNLHQRITEPARIRARAGNLRLKVANTQGRIVLHNSIVTAAEGDKAVTTKS